MSGFGDARTVQWAPELPQERESRPAQSSKVPQASTGACDACRARKVRCLANESSMSSKCQRCARAGRECVYTVHSKTRRRKRTDTRVKELEEKVKNLSMLLEQGKGDLKPVSRQESLQSHDSEGADMDDEDEWSDDDGEPEHQGTASGSRKNFDGFAAFREADSISPANNTPQTQTPPKPSQDIENPSLGTISPDVIEKGLISMEKAQELFYRYITELAPCFPGVYFAPETSAALMRKERPILFLAMLAAGAGNQDPTLNLALNQEILQVFATNVAIRGLKSLELVLSILVSTLWFFPPDKFEELKFHQYIHMAATMAQDIGLGKKPRAPRANDISFHSTGITGLSDQDPLSHPGPLNFYPDSTTMESRRTILACYLSCSTVSMGLRLPNMLRFTSWMIECLHVLETSPDAAPTDKRFAAWIRIQRVVEECAIAFSLDDSGSSVSLSDERVQSMLKGFETQLQAVMKEMKATPGVMDGFLEINYHINNVYIHEIALHPEHDAEDFKPPFFITMRSNKAGSPLAPAYVGAIMECMNSAQAVIKIFLGLQIESLRTLPALLYMRICYSCIVLIKLDISAVSPDSEIGKILDRNTLLTRAYVEKALLQMKRLAGKENKYVLAAKFCLLLGKLAFWYRQMITHQDGLAQHGDSSTSSFEKKRSRGPPPAGIASNPRNFKASQLTFPPANSMAGAMAGPPMAQPDVAFTNLNSFSGAPRYPALGHHPRFSAPAKLDPSTTTFSPNLLAVPTTGSGGTSQSSNYSLPEMIEQPDPQLSGPMEVDPSMFSQLEGADPFTYNRDPNDWMFEGLDYSNMENAANFDWLSIPEPQ